MTKGLWLTFFCKRGWHRWKYALSADIGRRVVDADCVVAFRSCVKCKVKEIVEEFFTWPFCAINSCFNGRCYARESELCWTHTTEAIKKLIEEKNGQSPNAEKSVRQEEA